MTKRLHSTPGANAKAPKETNPGSIQSVERALRILFLLADTDATLSVGQIAEKLGVHDSTASRLLSTLAQQNVVALTPNGYRLGLGLLGLSYVVLAELTIRNVAHPHLQKLSAETGCAVYLSTLLNHNSLYLDQVAADGTGTKTNWIGHSIPAHTASGGKVMLAYLPQDERVDYIGGGLTAHTRHTITETEAFHEQIAFVCEHGYAISRDEYLVGFSNVAAPVFNRAGQNNAAISLSGSTAQLSVERLHALAPLVIATANSVSLELGYKPNQNGKGNFSYESPSQSRN